MDFSTRDIALIAFGASFVYAWSVAIYRLTFHPLAKYPGPFLAKITGWYDAYHCARKDRHLDQYRCHQKYGPIVRYGPNFVLINTVGGLKDIYAGSKNSNVKKGSIYKFLHDHGATSTHSVIDKNIHAAKRRVLSQAFSDAALRSLDPHIIENIDLWLEALASKSGDKDDSGWTAPMNMSNWANYLTFDVLGDLCFGKSFGMITSSSQHYIPKLMMTRTFLFHFIGNSPLLPLWKPFSEKARLDRVFMPKASADMEHFRQFAGQAIKERMARREADKSGSDEAARKDFVYWLSKAIDPVTGKGYTVPEMLAESRLLIVAGSDTSSVTIAAALFYLARHPKILRKLQDELRSTFNSIDEIRSSPKLHSCVYLRAVIDETLRISPPVPSSLQREVMAGGMTADGHYFPEGTIVGTSAYAIHHREDYYRDPHVFRPERWIPSGGVTADEVAVAKSAFCPFSLGSRGCVGKPMAYAELSMALGRVFYRFDVKLKEGDHTGEQGDGEFAIQDLFISGRDGPYIEFHEGA